MSEVTSQKKSSAMEKFILFFERVGNKIPHPFAMFLFFAFILGVISVFTANIQIKVPGTENIVTTRSLFTYAFFRELLANLPLNYVNFFPFRLVLIMVIATALCEYTGLFEATIKRAFSKVSSRMLTWILVIIAVNGNVIGDSVDVILPSLAAIVFAAKGRNPLLGAIIAFACCGGGFNACFILSATDASLAGITEQAAQLLPITKNYPVTVAMNFYYNFISAVLLVPIGVFVAEKILAPIVDKNPEYAIDPDVILDTSIPQLSDQERKGVRWAGASLVIFIAIVCLLSFPANSLFRNPDTGNFLPSSPFMSSLVTLLTLAFAIPGLTYGIVTKKIRSFKDAVGIMGKGVESMSSFFVVCLAASIFTTGFGFTNIATLLAVKGSELLTAIGLTGVPMAIMFVLLFAFLNLFMISTAAKWVILAPICVPIFALMGFSPALATAIYRIGNSTTNVISPLNTSLPIIIAIMSRYKKNTGIGTVISMCMPFSIAFLICWTILAIVLLIFNVPLGPGASIYM